MLQRLLRGGRAGAAAASLAVALLAFWVAGFYWAPSDAEGRARAQSALFYFAVLPALAAATLPRLRDVLARSRVARAALAFAAFLALGVATAYGPQEQTAAQALRHLLATAVLVVGVAAVAAPAAREVVERVLLVAAASGAAASLLLLAAGRSFEGRAMPPVHDDHPNRWAAALGVAAVVALARIASRKAGPALACGALALVLPALFLTRSRAEMLAVVAGGAVAMLPGRDGRLRRLATAALLVALSAVALGAPEAMQRLFARGDAGREQIWGELLRRSDSRRLLGVGLTASDDVVFPPSWEFPTGWNPNTAHGEFLGTLYFGGVVGLGLLVLLLVLAARAASARARRSDMLVPGLLAHAVVWGIFDGRGGVTAPSDVVSLVLWLPVALSAAREVHGADGRPEAVPEVVPAPRARSRILPAALLATAVLLVVLRLPAPGGGTCEPWAFRQLESEWTARTLARAGDGLLRAGGPWLGDPGAGVFRLPLSEAAAALGLGVSGGSLPAARAAMLLLFVAGALPVALLGRRLAGRRSGLAAAVAWLALPLGFPGATALLPGTAALVLAPAAALLLHRGLARRSIGSLLASAVLAALVLLSEPSFLVPWAPFAAAVLLGRRRWRRALLALPLLALPVLPLLAGVARGVAPGPGADLSFLAGAVRAEADGRWPEPPVAAESLSWRLQRVADAAVTELAGPALLAAAIVGALLSTRRGRRRALLPVAGAAVHLLFLALKPPLFPDSELLADAPALALLVAAAVSWLAEGVEGLPAPARAAAAAGLSVLLLTGLPARARVEPAANPLALAVAEGMREAPAGSLALVLWRGPDGRGPHLVYAGGRGSWSVPEASFDREAVARLSGMGLRRLAVVSRAPVEGPFGPRWVAEAPIDGRGTRVRVYRVGPDDGGCEASQRAAARSFLAQVARNCGFVTSKSFSRGAS